MAHFDVGHRATPGSNGIQEVLLMDPPGEFVLLFLADQFVLLAVDPDSLPSQGHHSFGAVEIEAVVLSVVAIGRPDALFVDQQALPRVAGASGIDERHGVGVGEFLVVVEVELGPVAGGQAGVGLNAEPPAGEVDAMDTVVTDVPGAEVVEPVPVVVDVVGLVLGPFGGADPEIIIHVRRGTGRLLVPDVAPFLTVHVLGYQDFADHSFPEHSDGSDHAGAGPALGAVLHHPAVTAGGLDHLASLPDIVGAGLLHVDMLAGLAGQDGGRSVPVIAGGDDYRIHLRVVQDVAEVRDPMSRAGLLDGLRHALGVRVADVGHPAALQGGEVLAESTPPAAAADDPHVEAIVGAQNSAHRGSQPDGSRRQTQTRFLQECSTIRRGHLFTSSNVRTGIKDCKVALYEC